MKPIYTKEELEHLRIVDLETDLRCAERDGLDEYAKEIRAQLEVAKLCPVCLGDGLLFHFDESVVSCRRCLGHGKIG